MHTNATQKEEATITYHIGRRVVTAAVEINGRTSIGESRCHPDDLFDARTGKAIALSRALEQHQKLLERFFVFDVPVWIGSQSKAYQDVWLRNWFAPRKK